MPVGPLLIMAPVVGLLLTRGQRTTAGTASLFLVAWLNLWWVLPLVGFDRALPLLLTFPKSALILIAGHVAALILFLASIGVFSPHPGSAEELAIRAAQRGDNVAAGEFWLEAARPNRAFRAFKRGHAWARAAEVARGSGRVREAANLLTREGGAALGTAAQLYTRLGEEGLAQQLWLRYAQHLFENNQSESAIDPFLRAGDPRRAVHAAELAFQQHRLTPATTDAALRAAREAKRPQLAANIALGAGRFREAADLFLVSEQPLDAARAFERAGEPLRAAEALRLAGHDEEATRLRAQRLATMGHLDQAVEEYRSAGLLQEAADGMIRLGRHREAAELFRSAGQLREAADLARDHGDPREAAGLYEQIEEWAEAGNAWEVGGEPRAAARCFELAGDYERALALLAKAGLAKEQADLLARLGRVEEGFLVLFDRGDFDNAWQLLSGYGGTFPALVEPLMRLADWLRSQGELTGAISAVQRATAGLPATREVLPALYSLAGLLEDHGDLRAAETALQRVVEFDYSFRDAAPRLQAVAARRAIEESQISGAYRIGTGEAVPAGQDASSRYVLEQELGRGGMGVVYRALDQRLGRTVAIKVLNPRQHSAEALRRFEREARAAAALSHPGIVHIYDFDRGFESYFIAMEYVSGPTLTQLLREELPFVRHNLVPLMRQIADAVAYAHARQVVHRDLKPANMVLADRRQIKILDFGIARRLDELELSASGATGTPYYMAPEQILGEDPDERTDIYSLGVSFFQMATGKLPFTTGNVLRAHLEQPPPDPQSITTDLEPSVSHLVLRCLAKEPAQRYRDGSALVTALATIAEEMPR
ncbi:MAG: protein kinase domain-containing protein [Acidobacteriota bacterium]